MPRTSTASESAHTGKAVVMSPTPQVEVRGPMLDRFETVLTPDALAFLGRLESEFGGRRKQALEARAARQLQLSNGGTLDFLPETAHIRAGDWKVAPPAPGLVDRRVEITGPTERRMAINALNCGARV